MLMLMHNIVACTWNFYVLIRDVTNTDVILTSIINSLNKMILIFDHNVNKQPHFNKQIFIPKI